MQTCCAWTCRGEGPRPWFIIKSWAHLCSKRVYCPNLTSFSAGKFCQGVENWPQKLVFLLLHLNYFWPFPDFNLFISSPFFFPNFPGNSRFLNSNYFFLFWWEGSGTCCNQRVGKNSALKLLHQITWFFIYFCVWWKHQKICFCFGVCGDSGCVIVEWVQHSARFGSYA